MAEKRKLKIVFLSYYSGLVSRGVETFVHELANELTSLGHEVVVFQGGSKLKNSKYKTVSIKTKTNAKAKNSYAPFINYYANLVRRFTYSSLKQIDKDIDVIYPTNGQWQAVFCRLWAWKNGKKMVISGQSGPGLDDKINLYTFPDRFVALTKYQKEWARKQNPLVKTKVIPNGVDLKKFNESHKPHESTACIPKEGSLDPPSSTEARGLKPARPALRDLKLPKPIILNVSALVDWKRQELLIKAVAKLNEGFLLIVGSGQEKEYLEKLCEDLLPQRYKIIAYPYEQMPAVYAASDLFCFPTVPWESFGIVLLEAMASGLPIVATDDPIRHEIVGDAGIFVNPENTDQFAAAIKKALATKWGSKPRLQAEKYAWSKIGEMYENLFLEIRNEA